MNKRAKEKFNIKILSGYQNLQKKMNKIVKERFILKF